MKRITHEWVLSEIEVLKRKLEEVGMLVDYRVDNYPRTRVVSKLKYETYHDDRYLFNRSSPTHATQLIVEYDYEDRMFAITSRDELYPLSTDEIYHLSTLTGNIKIIFDKLRLRIQAVMKNTRDLYRANVGALENQYLLLSSVL